MRDCLSKLIWKIQKCLYPERLVFRSKDRHRSVNTLIVTLEEERKSSKYLLEKIEKL